MNYWYLNFARVTTVIVISILVLIFILSGLISHTIINEESRWTTITAISVMGVFTLLMSMIVNKLILSRWLLFCKDCELLLIRQGAISSLPETPDYLLPRLYNMLDQVIEKAHEDNEVIKKLQRGYQSILDTQTEFVLVIDENRYATYSNQAFQQLIRWDKSCEEHFIINDFMIDDIVSLITKDHSDILIRARKSPDCIEFQSQIKVNDKLKYIDWRIKYIEPDASIEFSTANYLFVGRDVTDELNLEHKARQLSNLAIVGRSASFISHEVNQPLSVISLATRSLQEFYEEGELDKETFWQKSNTILGQVERIETITRELKLFGRSSHEKPDYFGLTEAIESCLTENEYALLKEGINIQKQFNHDDTCLLGNETLFKQAMLNLISNALYALNENKIRHPYMRIITALNKGSVYLCITDNAGGAPKEAIKNVMDPFYSTKPAGKGSGIGLALCFDVIEKMQGTMKCSNGHEGFQIEIILPVTSQSDNE